MWDRPTLHTAIDDLESFWVLLYALLSRIPPEKMGYADDRLWMMCLTKDDIDGMYTAKSSILRKLARPSLELSSYSRPLEPLLRRWCAISASSADQLDLLLKGVKEVDVVALEKLTLETYKSYFSALCEDGFLESLEALSEPA